MSLKDYLVKSETRSGHSIWLHALKLAEDTLDVIRKGFAKLEISP